MSTVVEQVADRALDDALARIRDLAARLWAVRQAHRPQVAGWVRTRTRCAGCGQPVPCLTLRVAEGQPGVTAPRGPGEQWVDVDTEHVRVTR